VTLAKRLATIDVLSAGRMRLLTVGLGTLPGQARALGVDFDSRGRRVDEAIDVLRLLWEGDERGVSFHGEFFDVDDLVSYPKPYGVTHLPIHVGGSSRPAARRAGARGDGYFPGGALTAQERAFQWDLVRSTAARSGRDPETLEYTRWGSIDLSVDAVEALAAQGVTRIVVSPASADPQEQRDQMSAFADRFGLTDQFRDSR
jgi:alkanesulfonate monooxygenase SsuD/methylene tetrahydromethanopterin reductase-like flavin-dependent oxidoreductase (luciferase family)